MEQDKKMIEKIKSFKIKKFLKKFSNLESIKTLSNLEQRVLSSLILVPIILYSVFISETLFLLLILAITVLAAFEWNNLTKSDEKNKNKWLWLGFFYLLIPFYSIIELRSEKNIILWLFFVV